ncbi:small subunit ribosomal protein S27e [Enteropsectra breve]|nr:small subunit ribosomal protein S27e [Enteropsectra breve]
MMYKLHLPVYTPNIHKKKTVYKQAKGYFNKIRCSGCEQETVCYSHSQTDIKCKGCSAPLVKSKGGRAQLVDEDAGVKRVENEY